MSAPNQGRQSPEPERQNPDQQSSHPSQPGSGKLDNSADKDEGKTQEEQTANLTSNPEHPLQKHAEEKTINAAPDDEIVLDSASSSRKGWRKGENLPVSCLNRTIDTGEHITDVHGNLQYIPFPTCNETSQPLSFLYNTPEAQTCTIDFLPDEMYHLLEFFVHNDVPLTCRIPSYPLSPAASALMSNMGTSDGTAKDIWTPLTIALQGTLQLSHLHLHTDINVLLHTTPDTGAPSRDRASHLIAATAYSLPNTSVGAPSEGIKVIRNEPLTFIFNIAWIDGAVLPGMVGRPVSAVVRHNLGFSLLSFFAIVGSAGIGALGMLVYERRKSGRSMNGLLGGNAGNGTPRVGGYGGYGGYSTGSIGKRD